MPPSAMMHGVSWFPSPLHFCCVLFFLPLGCAPSLFGFAAAVLRRSGRCGHATKSWALLPHLAHPEACLFGHTFARCPWASQIQQTEVGVVDVTARRGVDLNGLRLGNGRTCRRGYRVSAFHNKVHNSSREQVCRPCSWRRNCTSAFNSGRIPSHACQYSAVSPSGWTVASSSTLRIYSSAVPVCFREFHSLMAFSNTLRGMNRCSNARYSSSNVARLCPLG